MEDLYFFWNAFNLIGILTLTMGASLLIGAGISIVLTIITQVEDSAVSFFSKFFGCALGSYIMSPFILGSVKEFSERVWGGSDLFK